MNVKDESQNQPFDSNIDPQLAARIVALVVGEASDFERDELNQLMAQRPELVAFKDHIQDVHGLMLEVGSGELLEPDESWKLSNEKRNKVLAVISGQDEVESSEAVQVRLPPTTTSTNQRLLRNFIVAAAVLLMGGFLFSMAMPRLFSSRHVTSMARVQSAAADTAPSMEASNDYGYFEASGGLSVDLGNEAMSVAEKFEAMNEAKIAENIEPNAAENSKSALSSIRDSLASNSIATGMTAVGPTVTEPTTTGTTLPSPYYLQDDVQYFSVDPETDKSRQPETRYTGKDPSKPKPSQQLYGDFAVAVPEAIDAAGMVDESVRWYATPSRRVTREPGRPELGFPTAEMAPARESASMSDGSTKLFGGAIPSKSEKSGAGVSIDSPVELWDSNRADANHWAGNPSSRPSSGSSRVPSEKLSVPALSKEPEAATRRSATAAFSGSGSVTNEGRDQGQAASREYDRSDSSMDMEMGSMEMGMGIDSKEFDGFAGLPTPNRGLKSESMRFGAVPLAETEALRNKSGAIDGGRRRFFDRDEDLIAQSVPEPADAPEVGQSRFNPSKPSDALPGQLQGKDFDVRGLNYGLGTTLQDNLAKNFKEPQESPAKVDSSDAWGEGKSTLDAVALNPHGGRQKFLAEKQSQLTDELRRKEITLKQVEKIAAQAKAPAVVVDVLSTTLDRTVDLNSARQQIAQGMVESDAQLAQIEVDKQLLPLMLERNKHAAQFGKDHPSVKELDSKLSVMKQEMKRLEKGQSNQLLELMEENEQPVADSKAKAAEAVASMIDASKTEVALLKSQIASIKQQAASERPPETKSAAGLGEKSAQDEAFSTFSLHVSDVSFKLAQAALSQGEWPDAAKIRIEEFVNAFDYGDPMPSQTEKVACRLEQCIHPFLQQRNLLRVSMRTGAAGRAANTPLRLTLLLDNSGSMERIDRQQTVRRAFALLAQQLKPIDQVTLISFARQPRLLADKFSGDKSGQLVQLVENLPSEGGTNIEAALQLAFEKALQQRVDNAQNRIILLTDGAVNLGNANPESLSRMIMTMRDAGIAFDAAGIGAAGLNDEVLEALTRKGDGRYYLLDSAEDADEGFVRQIAGALRPSAKNVKVQIQFNPKRVGRYKLLGFEKHRLKKEDFRDDKVDAAEMAAAEAGVAMYQFEAKPDGEGDVGSLFVRFQDLSTGEMIENCWPIPYDYDAPRVDQAAASLRIATSAAMLAAKLRGERLGETVDLKTLSNLISSLPEQDRRAKRVQQLQLMIQQARQVIGN